MAQETEQPWSYMLPTLRATYAKNPRIRILDVGCGNGKITIELAKVAPEAEVIGIDESSSVLASAAMYAWDVKNVTFKQGDIYRLAGLGLDTFDIVCTHQVLAHCTRPVEAVKSLVGMVKKGGVLCLREGDLESGRFGGFDGKEVLQECFGVINEVHKAEGKNVDAGSRLTDWLNAAGIKQEMIVEAKKEVRLETREQREEYGRAWPARCTQGEFGRKAVKLGATEYRPVCAEVAICAYSISG